MDTHIVATETVSADDCSDQNISRTAALMDEIANDANAQFFGASKQTAGHSQCP
jgi:hypothetical protein